MIRIPDKIVIARIADPVTWTRTSHGLMFESLVEWSKYRITGATFIASKNLVEIEVAGYTWRSRSWLGWTLVAMWLDA